MTRGQTPTKKKKGLQAKRVAYMLTFSLSTLTLRNLSSDMGPPKERVLQLLHLTNIQDLLEWTDASQLNLTRITTAMTNIVYIVSTAQFETMNTTSSAGKRTKVLLRIYGDGPDPSESVIDRKNELEWLCRLSSFGIGPLLLGIFKNGRFEEFLDSDALSKEDLSNDKTSQEIARQLCKLHHVAKEHKPEPNCVPKFKQNIELWIPRARDAIKTLCDLEALKDFDFESLEVEIRKALRYLARVPSPMVFGHNDVRVNPLAKWSLQGYLQDLSFSPFSRFVFSLSLLGSA